MEGKPEIERLRCVIAELEMQLKQFGDEKMIFSENIQIKVYKSGLKKIKINL